VREICAKNTTAAGFPWRPLTIRKMVALFQVPDVDKAPPGMHMAMAIRVLLERVIGKSSTESS
jgi:hypothetical protein